MNTYLISYDLIQPGKDYTDLITYIKSLGGWAKPLQSVWLIKSYQSATVIRDGLLNHIDNNDKLFVIQVTGVSAWHNLPDTVANWLKTEL